MKNTDLENKESSFWTVNKQINSADLSELKLKRKPC